jgi:O-antigen ligase
MSKFTRIFYGLPYQLFVSAATILVWTMGWENYGLPIALGLMFLEFVFLKDSMPTIPLFMNALFMVSRGPSFDAIPLYLYMTPVSILLGMTIHAIRFKVNLFRGAMLPGVLVMLAALGLSTLNAGETLSPTYGFYALIGLLYAVVYLFYVNTIQGDHVRYLIRMMFLLGLVVSLEVLIYYLRVDDVVYAIEHKTITLGWGISNYIATYLILFVPMTFYYAKTTKLPLLWILVGIFEGIMLLFTVSRGGIIAFAGTFALCALYLMIQKKWWHTALHFLGAFAAIAVVAWIGRDFFETLYERFALLLLDDTGRIPIWLDAIEKFKEHPLFGNGLFARLDEFGVYRMFHNTFLHTAATFGLVGLAGLAMQLFVQFKWVVRRRTPEALFLGIALLGAHMHGMVDNIYYMPQFMIVIVIILAVSENAYKPAAPAIR